jgi:hypothetical protein
MGVLKRKNALKRDTVLERATISAWTNKSVMHQVMHQHTVVLQKAEQKACGNVAQQSPISSVLTPAGRPQHGPTNW